MPCALNTLSRTYQLYNYTLGGGAAPSETESPQETAMQQEAQGRKIHTWSSG